MHWIFLSVPPDLCLLGCIFHIIDYQDDSEKSEYVPSWTKTIRQYGGEVEASYQPRITHLLCMNQTSVLAQQALREGKRIVTSYWLNDVVARKKVTPPWKAVHFPLPKEWVKAMRLSIPKQLKQALWGDCYEMVNSSNGPCSTIMVMLFTCGKAEQA